MAATTEAAKAVFDAVTTAVTNDTAVGGLWEVTGGAASVKDGGITRRGDADRTNFVPRLELDISMPEEQCENTNRAAEGLLRVMVITDRDQELTKQDAIEHAVVKLLNLNAGLGTVNGWDISPPAFLRSFQGDISEKRLTWVCEFAVVARV